MMFSCLLVLISLLISVYSEIPILLEPPEGMRPRVVDGWKANSPSEVPYQVSFKTRTRDDASGRAQYRNFCGGSIISRNRVLSAAHCFVSEGNFCSRLLGGGHQLNKISRYVAVAGSLLTTSSWSTLDSPTRGQWRRLTAVNFPYTYKFPKDDIAVVHLRRPFVFNSNISAISISSPRFADYRGTCSVSGFGRMHRTAMMISPYLLLGQVEILSTRQCSTRQRKKADRWVCASNAMSRSGEGDSGGPLVCKGTGDANEGSRGLLVGVVCGGNAQGTIYTRVSVFHDYIMRGGGRRHKGNILFVFVILLFLIPF